MSLCDPIDSSPPGSPVPGILQARTLEWVAVSFSNAWKWKVKVKSLSCVRLLATPWTAAHQAPPSMGFSRQEYWSGVPLPSLIESLILFNSVNSVVTSPILFLVLVTWVLPIFLFVYLAKYLSSILLFWANCLFHFFLFSHSVSFISTLFWNIFIFSAYFGFLKIFHFSYFKTWR